MSTNNSESTIHWLVIGLIFFAIVSRLVPHPPNFTPIGAIGLFAGANLTVKRYWLVPVIALLAGDFAIGAYHPVSMLSVYLSFIVSALLGKYFLLHKPLLHKTAPLWIGGGAVLSAVQFFIISNLGTWLSGLIYPLTFSGLVDCYVMAIPYFGNTLAGDLFYSTVLFGCFALCSTLIHKRLRLTAN